MTLDQSKLRRYRLFRPLGAAGCLCENEKSYMESGFFLQTFFRAANHTKPPGLWNLRDMASCGTLDGKIGGLGI